MSVLEIVSGVILLLISIIIIIIVVIQQPSSNQNGLSGTIQGGQSYYGQGKVKTKDFILKKLTVIAGIVLFAATILVSVTRIFK